jgi:methanogenic corrinoid protein MtbC1
MTTTNNEQASFTEVGTELAEDTYKNYLSSLLKGNRLHCSEIVGNLLNAEMPVKYVYQALFQRALYQVGELWESNKISVAAEHIATSVTEGLMNQIYADIIPVHRAGKKAVIASAENELHQVGAKMVADIFEMHGWDSFYVGANTPTQELIRFARDIQPDVIGISISVDFHAGTLEKMIEALREAFEHTEILIGGQAFRFSGESLTAKYPGVFYISSLDALEDWIKQRRN